MHCDGIHQRPLPQRKLNAANRFAKRPLKFLANCGQGVLGLHDLSEASMKMREVGLLFNGMSKYPVKGLVASDSLTSRLVGILIQNTRHPMFSTMHHVPLIHDVVKHADSLHVARDREEELTGAEIKPCGKQDFGTQIAAVLASLMPSPKLRMHTRGPTSTNLKCDRVCRSLLPRSACCMRERGCHAMYTDSFSRRPGLEQTAVIVQTIARSLPRQQMPSCNPGRGCLEGSH